jgi:opacity protein-like surface antigen
LPPGRLPDEKPEALLYNLGIHRQRPRRNSRVLERSEAMKRPRVGFSWRPVARIKRGRQPMIRDLERGRPRRLLLSAVLLLAWGGTTAGADAGDAPKMELFGGYSYLREDFLEKNFPLGWNVSLAANVTPSLGLVADVGGHYQTEEGIDFSIHNFLGGLRFSYRLDSVTPYAEALMGVTRASASAGDESESSRDFSVQGGAGLGFPVSDRLAIRAGVDFRKLYFEGGSSQEIRVGIGLSFGFGGTHSARAETVEPRTPPTPSTFREPPVGPPAPQTPPPPPPPAVAPEPEPLDVAPEPEPPLAPALETEAVAPPALPAPAPAPFEDPLAADPLIRGQELLRAGSYPEAADAHREYLEVYGRGSYTIPVAVYCDLGNLAAHLGRAEGYEELFLIRRPVGGRTCWGIYWRLFGSRAGARSAMDRLPASLRSSGQVPIAVGRLLGR